MRNGKTEKTDVIVSRCVASPSFKGRKQYRTEQIFYYWPKIVGELIAAHVTPVRLDFRTLYVTADTPVWANEMRYMTQKLIDKINAYVAAELVREIRFGAPGFRQRRKPVQEYPAPRAEMRQGVREETPHYAVSAEEQKADAACAAIEDDRLRAAVRRVLDKSRARTARAAAQGVGPCPKCGAPNQSHTDKHGRRTLCTNCTQAARAEKRRAIRALLTEQPWLYYYEVANIVDCPPHEVMNVRMQMIQTLAGRIRYGDETSEDAKRLVMLDAQVKEELLTPERMHAVLQRYRYDVIIDWEHNPPKKSGGKNGRGKAAARRQQPRIG